MNVKTRPVIRWAGSKRQLVPHLRSWVPKSYRRYIEPFAGSACLYFDLRPKCAILGDINFDLIQAYRQLRRTPSKLHEVVAGIPRTPKAYYEVRSTDPEALGALERAARFIYLNRNCFNAVYRVNRDGRFNVPWGTKTGSLPSREDFCASGTALRNATLLVSDFECLVDEAHEGDFLYVDPPYTSSVAGEPGLFGSGAFTRHDMQRLVLALQRASARGVIYVLSFEFDKEIIRALLSATIRRTVLAHRHVSGFSGARGKVKELLVTNAIGVAK